MFLYIRAFTLLISITLISACSATGLLVPLIGIPSSNYLTGEYYEDEYNKYDAAYRKHTAFKEHLISREQYKLYAREFGAQKDTLKPAIILMHGFPDSLHIYDRLAPLLAEHYRVISFDFMGWGKSDKPDDHEYNSESLYQDLEIVINYFKLKKVSLVVHDASGPPGIDWAIKNSDKMEMLVLLNTYYYPMKKLITPEAIVTFSTPSITRTIIRTGARLSDLGWKIGFQHQLSKFFYDEAQRDIMLPVLTYQAMDIKNAFFQLNDVLNIESKRRLKIKDRLHEYKGDVKIIFGKEDPYLNKHVAINFRDIFPNSTLYLIGSAAHFVQLDNPDSVAKKILDEKSWHTNY